MSSLHEKKVATVFANKCYKLWKDWNRLNSPKVDSRIRAYTKIVHAAIKKDNITFPPRIVLANLSDHGQFVYGASSNTWEIQLKRSNFANNGLKCKDFVELCTTVYHETRHAEQMYRILQKSFQEFKFSSIRSNLDSQLSTKYDIPTRVVKHARKHQSSYKKFCKITNYDVYSRGGDTVDERIDIMIDQSKSWGIGGRSLRENPEDFGQGSSDVADFLYFKKSYAEMDARDCEGLLKKELINAFPMYDTTKNWKRTNPHFASILGI